MVHLHNGVLLSGQTYDLLKFAGKWMELEKKKKNNLSEVTQTQKNKPVMYSLISRYQM